jgi:hypothetical protein
MAVRLSIALEHAINEISQWSPEILATVKVVLVYEEDVMLEAGVEMCLESELANNRVVVAVYVGIDAIHSLEDLPDHAWEGLREWDAY